MRIGLRFDWRSAAGSGSELRLVTDYVMSRQRERLKKRVKQ